MNAAELVVVLPGHPPPPPPATVLYPHRLHLSRRLNVFIAWMAGVLAEAMMLPRPGTVPREEPT